jgi:hypothetical protein
MSLATAHLPGDPIPTLPADTAFSPILELDEALA